jgi:triacylglycerol lipase
MNISSLLNGPPIWAEGRATLETGSLLRSRVFKGEGVVDAAGQPVLLIPGFLAGDTSLGLMTGWLRRTGHRTKRAGIRFNVGCSGAVMTGLEERLECIAEARGRKVAIVGQSRGGTFARALAVRRPDLVSGIVGLGSPVLDPFAVHPLVRLTVLSVGTLGTLGAPGFFRHDCKTGECCDAFWRDLRAPFPEAVGFTAVYSRSDGVVDYRACLDPAAERVEVSSSHVGMSLNSGAYRITANALARFRAHEAETAGAPLSDVA